MNKYFKMFAVVALFTIAVEALAQSILAPGTTQTLPPYGAIYKGSDPLYSEPFFSNTISAGQTYYVLQAAGDVIYSDASGGTDALAGPGLFTPLSNTVYQATATKAAGVSVTNILLSTFSYHGKFRGDVGSQLNNQTYVSAVYGNDATAKTNDWQHPFKTCTAAKNAITNANIWVLPGMYNENKLLKNGVNWYWCAGATNLYTGLDTNAIFADVLTGPGVVSTIAGQGVFIWDCQDTSFTLPPIGLVGGVAVTSGTGVMVTQNSNTIIHFSADAVLLGGPDTVGFGGTISALWCFTCKEIIWNCNKIGNYVTGADQEVSACYWDHGNVIMNVGAIDLDEGPAFLTGDDNTADSGLPYAETSLYINASEIICTNTTLGNPTFATYSYTDRPRIWVQCPHIANLGTGAGAPIFQMKGDEKIYVTTQKLDYKGSTAAITQNSGNQSVSNSVGVIWLDAEKVSSKGSWFASSGGTFFAHVINWEDQGGMTNGFEFDSVNTVPNAFIQGGRALLTNAPCILYTNGNVSFNNMIIDTHATQTAGNYGATVRASGLQFQDCKFFVPTNSFPFNAASAFNVQALACYFNTNNSANITLSPSFGCFTNTSLK